MVSSHPTIMRRWPPVWCGLPSSSHAGVCCHHPCMQVYVAVILAQLHAAVVLAWLHTVVILVRLHAAIILMQLHAAVVLAWLHAAIVLAWLHATVVPAHRCMSSSSLYAGV